MINIVTNKDWTLEYVRHSSVCLNEGNFDAHLREETSGYNGHVTLAIQIPYINEIPQTNPMLNYLNLV
jgi:hypothetical protein